MVISFSSKSVQQIQETLLYDLYKLLNVDRCHTNILRLQTLERRCKCSVVVDSASGSYPLSILSNSVLIERCMAQV